MSSVWLERLAASADRQSVEGNAAQAGFAVLYSGFSGRCFDYSLAAESHKTGVSPDPYKLREQQQKRFQVVAVPLRRLYEKELCPGY